MRDPRMVLRRALRGRNPHTYGYAIGNPLKFIDPDGQAPMLYDEDWTDPAEAALVMTAIEDLLRSPRANCMFHQCSRSTIEDLAVLVRRDSGSRCEGANGWASSRSGGTVFLCAGSDAFRESDAAALAATIAHEMSHLVCGSYDQDDLDLGTSNAGDFNLGLNGRNSEWYFANNYGSQCAACGF
jgi:hypothetical protein